MSKELAKETLEEKAARKEVAKKRKFWFLFAFNIVLVIYLVIQIILIVTAK